MTLYLENFDYQEIFTNFLYTETTFTLKRLGQLAEQSHLFEGADRASIKKFIYRQTLKGKSLVSTVYRLQGLLNYLGDKYSFLASEKESFNNKMDLFLKYPVLLLSISTVLNTPLGNTLPKVIFPDSKEESLRDILLANGALEDNLALFNKIQTFNELAHSWDIDRLL